MGAAPAEATSQQGVSQGMGDLMTVEQLAEKIRESLTEFVSTTLGVECLHAIVERLSHDLLTYGDPCKGFKDLWVELGLIAFGIGCPRKVCEMLKALPMYDIDWMYESFGEGPGNMIYLEWMLRHGKILAWDTGQETMENGTLLLNIQPKQPLNFVKIDFTLENKQ